MIGLKLDLDERYYEVYKGKITTLRTLLLSY
jgi:hypothetical protein